MNLLQGEYQAFRASGCLFGDVRSQAVNRKLRKYEPDAEVIRQANQYLKAIGQAGTPLRAEEATIPASGGTEAVTHERALEIINSMTTDDTLIDFATTCSDKWSRPSR